MNNGIESAVKTKAAFLEIGKLILQFVSEQLFKSMLKQNGDKGK